MNTPSQERPEYKTVPQEARAGYFLNYVRDEQRRKYFDFIRKTAKLNLKPRETDEGYVGWNNVMKHNVCEAAAMRALCEDLKLPKDEAEKLEKYALIHNPTIHRDKYQAKVESGADTSELPDSETFTDSESQLLDESFYDLVTNVDPDGSLRLATSPEFFDKIAGEDGVSPEQVERMPFNQMLMYYIDALFIDGKLVPAHERIQWTEDRRQDLNQDEVRTERLGMKYWDAERLGSTKIQAMIFERLKANDIGIESAEDVPAYIKGRVAEEMVKLWNEYGHDLET
ncbi:MAG: hypothetical protein K9M03_03495 [Kiritimatiellales bacterium]|nr:hypothetical protein [Kiritimatiellales bacterium]